MSPIPKEITASLEAWLEEGRGLIGQVAITKLPDGSYDLRHHEDAGNERLETFFCAGDARAIATWDDAGDYRPLKSAPSLRHRWRLLLPDAAAAHAALDFLYPAALGLYRAHRAGSLDWQPLRATLGRQTGMYRVAGLVSDAAAREVVAETCNSTGRCLRTLLWNLAPGEPLQSLPATKSDLEFDQTGQNRMCIPLLCREACCLVVAAARTRAKADQNAGSPEAAPARPSPP